MEENIIIEIQSCYNCEWNNDLFCDKCGILINVEKERLQVCNDWENGLCT